MKWTMLKARHTKMTPFICEELYNTTDMVGLILTFFFLYSSSDDSQSNQKPPRGKTYLVFESCLHNLFCICRDCKRPSKTVFSTIRSTCMLQVKVICCVCESEWTWNNQPYVCGIPHGNILMSAAIPFSGSLVSKPLCAFR